MILPWKNYLQTNEVSLLLPNGIKYIAYPNSDEEVKVKKIDVDGTETSFGPEEWHAENLELKSLLTSSAYKIEMGWGLR